MQWNTFVDQAKNATFLFYRDFMEYHIKRFEDYSLLVFDEKENLRAVLPANRVGDAIYSHQGLTYGGFVLDKNIKLAEIVILVKKTLEFLFNNGVKTLDLKIIPTIYNTFPSDEMEYICFLLNAKLVRKDSLSVLALELGTNYSKDRIQAINKGNKNKLIVKEESNFELFWNEILIPNLVLKHNVQPVHTLEEIKKLKSNFPNNIRQFNVYKENKIIAGTTIFESKNVAHSQYISGNNDKNKLGSLDFLHNKLIKEIFVNKKYFDFGISNENQGKNINQGLQYWKESFGARTIIQNFYRIETVNFSNLETVLI